MDLDSQSQLMARAAIERKLISYARGVDRRDWDLVRSCYHPDAFDSHGPYQGGVDGLIAWMEERHAHISFSYHLISNVLIDFDGPDSAWCEAYCVTTQRSTPDSAEALAIYGVEASPDGRSVLESEVQARIVDRYERRDEIWAVACRTVVFETIRIQAIPSESSFPATWATGTRDFDDPSFT